MAGDRHTNTAPQFLGAAVAAYLTGREDECLDLLTHGHQIAVDSGDRPAAARAAFWIAFQLLGGGDQAQASGWIGRARRLLEEHAELCVECGYILLPQGLAAFGGGDLARAEQLFAEAESIGQRFHERDLVALARQGRGRVFIASGRVTEGVALLDEVMLSVTSGELMPVVAGTIYCSVIAACFDLFDVGRAQEWTEALNEWCAARPGLVPYRGDCLANRSAVLRLRGRWHDAAGEATQATTRPATRQAAKAAALYELAEIHRLEGDVAAADDAYRRAAELGRQPQPGLALLRLSQGDVAAARASITRALAEHRGRHRSSMLAAAVEIFVAAADLDAARTAAAELSLAADGSHSPWLGAMAHYADGTLRLAERQPAAALARLQDALSLWRQLDIPYEAARTRAAIGAACVQLGDNEGARLERDAAARAFRDIGAAADLARMAPAKPSAPTGGLTPREVEVLQLVARGQTNREIANALDISEKTVARHLSNIFTKLDLPTRAAATAYAFRHGLVK